MMAREAGNLMNLLSHRSTSGASHKVSACPLLFGPLSFLGKFLGHTYLCACLHVGPAGFIRSKSHPPLEFCREQTAHARGPFVWLDCAPKRSSSWEEESPRAHTLRVDDPAPFLSHHGSNLTEEIPLEPTPKAFLKESMAQEPFG